MKTLSQLATEAEIREGAQATAINRFFARFNSLPTAVRKEILEGNVKVSLTTFYDTIYNITTTPTLRFFSTEETRNPKVGITNLATNKLELSQIFFVDSVRLLHAEIKKSSGGTNITEATEATVTAVQGVKFGDTELPTNIVNGTFEMQIGGQVVVSNLLMTEFLDLQYPKNRPKVKLENVFLADGKPFEITINLAGSNLKVHDVLRMEVSGVLISK